ncbi:MAG: pirin family protein [Spirochaetales bacterium]|nr:pirin family protein [Spirochaetales bacterium]
MNFRNIKETFISKPVLEGAGVHLRRAFGYYEVPLFDPFLLFDDFRSNNPQDYLQGFPWHPHRGIETITYVLAGEVEHGDSMGNKGIISAGDVQWMTAGSGIIHQEMPEGDDSGRMYGFQLWANLPAADKMMDPRYRGILDKDIPVVEIGSNVKIRVISGTVNGVQGPVREIVTDPEYLDISLRQNSNFMYEVKNGYTVFVYVIEGNGFFSPDKNTLFKNYDLILFDDGDTIAVSTHSEPVRFLLASGRPIGEPVAWGGPVVMNTEEELNLAFKEYETGTFIKKK